MLCGIALLNGYAQETFPRPNGGEYVFNPNKVSCVTESERISIQEILEKKKDLLKKTLKKTKKDNPLPPSFIWPVRQAEGFGYNSVWGISNYVDHSTSSDLIDFNCGNRTYDGHMGTDIYLWPFSWKMMDEEQAEVIAAEDGIIIFKDDGHFDQSCVMGGGSWNAIYLLHDDGSISWYGHMKSATLTSKDVGDSVEKGEFLGKVGSSGNSTGPHLHFEVYDAEGALIDPFTGNCNSLNTSSWWETQQGYTEPNVNAVLTHTAPPAFNDCPEIESANISTTFASGDTVYAAIYMRDQEPDTTINLRIRRPNGTLAGNWAFTFDTYYSSSYWYWLISPNMDGVWTWEAEYNGETVAQTFTVGTLGTNENSLSTVSVYPNPTTGLVTLEDSTNVSEVTITDALGKIIAIEKNPDGIKQADLSALAHGVYFLTMTAEDNKSRTVKIVRQ